MLFLFRSKTAFVSRFFSELQTCFLLALLLTLSLIILGTVGIWTDSLCPPSQWKWWKSDIRCSVFQRCIQSASLPPGTHSFFFWTQRILNEGYNWTQKKLIECLCKLQTPGKNGVTRYATLRFVKTIFIFTVYFAVNFQTKAEKPLCFSVIPFLSC